MEMSHNSIMTMKRVDHILGGQSDHAGEERSQECQDHPQDAHLRASVLGRKAGILP
jgi:hypothetical protein